MKTALLLILTLLMVIGIAQAQDDSMKKVGEAEHKATLDDLQWMVGRWVGEAFGGKCEEIWSEPSGGTMIGTFKLIMNGKASMYEIMMISLKDGKPVMTLKHFNGDLTGWEEKDSFIVFPYVESGPNEIIFDGLTYKRTGDTMSIKVVTGEKDGKPQANVIKCTRSKL